MSVGKFCPRCRNDAGDHHFCPECGEYVRWDDLASAAPTATAATVSAMPSKETRTTTPASAGGNGPIRRQAGILVTDARTPRGTVRIGTPPKVRAAPTLAVGETLTVTATIRNESAIVDEYNVSLTERERPVPLGYGSPSSATSSSAVYRRLPAYRRRADPNTWLRGWKRSISCRSISAIPAAASGRSGSRSRRRGIRPRARASGSSESRFVLAQREIWRRASTSTWRSRSTTMSASSSRIQRTSSSATGARCAGVNAAPGVR